MYELKKIAMCLIFTLPSLASGVEPVVVHLGAAHPYTHPRDKRREDAKHWRDIQGVKVAVEGIAWGSYEKGNGEYVIFNDGKLYVPDADFVENASYGRPIRVSGILRQVRELVKSDAGDRTFVYYRIENAKWHVIGKVEWPWLVVEK